MTLLEFWRKWDVVLNSESRTEFHEDTMSILHVFSAMQREKDAKIAESYRDLVHTAGIAHGVYVAKMIREVATL